MTNNHIKDNKVAFGKICAFWGQSYFH